MIKKRLWHVIILVIKRMADPYYQGVAAELAFFFLLSLVPSTIILGELLGVFSISMEVISKLLNEYMTPEIASVLSTFVSYEPSGAISGLLIILSLWAASKAHFSMMRISNYSFTGQQVMQGYLKERFRAIKTILITIFTLAFSLIIIVYGELIVEIVTAYFVKFLGTSFTVDKVWYFLRWPIALALYLMMISYNYYVLPTGKLKFKKILPGSITASVGMLLATWIYSYYAEVFANYDLLYGSLASIVALLLWFYILGFILVIGIQVNVVWDKTK